MCDCLIWRWIHVIQELQEAIRPETSLVSIMAVNNEIGVRQPIEHIGIYNRNSLNTTVWGLLRSKASYRYIWISCYVLLYNLIRRNMLLQISCYVLLYNLIRRNMSLQKSFLSYWCSPGNPHIDNNLGNTLIYNRQSVRFLSMLMIWRSIWWALVDIRFMDQKVLKY